MEENNSRRGKTAEVPEGNLNSSPRLLKFLMVEVVTYGLS
jgi:hypothetical protein